MRSWQASKRIPRSGNCQLRRSDDGGLLVITVTYHPDYAITDRVCECLHLGLVEAYDGRRTKPCVNKFVFARFTFVKCR